MRSAGRMRRVAAGTVLAVVALSGMTIAGTTTGGAQVSPPNPTLQPWTAGTSLPEARSRGGAVFGNGYLYMVGGVNAGGNNVATTFYAPVNANGSVGAWASTTSLPGVRRTVRPAYANGYLYLAGGNDGANFRTEVYRAAVNANGTIGTWTETTPLPTASTSHSTIAYNGYLYVVGGNTGASCVTNVRYAAINADGSLGAWQSASALPAARCGNVEAVAIANGYMYAVGGYNNSNVTGQAYSATINANGSLGAWQTSPNSLNTAREYNATEILNGYLYVIGGQPALSGNATANVEVAQLTANGGIGPFTSTTSMPGGRSEGASEAINGRLYEIGGGTGQSGASAQDSVFITSQTTSSDSTPPTVSLTAPSAGATLSGSATVSANASDNAAVAGVQFLLDGNVLGAEDTTAPYSISWDTTTAANGAHTVSARARDTSGNSTTSAAVNVSVSNQAPPSTPSLLAYGLEQGSGTTAIDSSANANHATITSGTWTSNGRYGNAVTFDGNATRLRAGANVTLGPSFTYETWINNPANNAYETILTVGRSRDLYLASGVPTLWTGNADLSLGSALPTGTWTHLALTYDGTTLRSYVNGSQTGTATTTIAATTDTVQAGAWINGAANDDYFSGTLDEVRVYNRALSQAEIQADMAAPISTPVDTTPPTVSNGQPTGTLPPGTTSTALQVTTNEAASCRYATTAGTAYSAMTSTFATTGATAHTTPVSGLANGQSYTFYVRCQDPAGNATTSDTVITFAVAAPDAVPPSVSVSAPAAGATVSGSVTVSANAADNTAVAGVQFLLDGNNLGAEDTSAPYSVAWDTSTATNGAHTLSARARDAAGNQTTSATVNVTVSNTAPPPSPALVAYGFGQGSGTTATDSSANANHGTITSGTWTASGRYGNAVTFDGTASRVRAGANVALGSAFTYEAWINNPANNAYETILTVGRSRDLYLASGVPTFWTGNADISFGGALPANTWVHVALTYDGTTLRLYVNGAAYGTAATTTIAATTDAMQVGAWINGAANDDYFSGTIDEVRLYNRALSMAEIQTDMAAAIA